MIVAYTALYRAYRPARFEDMVGQEAVVATLKNQVASGRIAHAYLFCGSRGTGKTSAAKILARAVNCEHPEEAPCGHCGVCERSGDEGFIDILEIDAASNNGVEEIRDLREKVKYPPAYGRYKVYIIDEVHMLSTGAFNALLKTLEEPPAHVVFILATTEPSRLPATVLSRCQRFDFRRLDTATLTGLLRDVVGRAGGNADEKALMLIARMAKGGARDALSIADMALSYGERITEATVRDILGMPEEERMAEMAEAVLEGDSSAILEGVREVYTRGQDLAVFAAALAGYFRDLLAIRSVKNPADVVDASPEELERMGGLAAKYGRDELFYAASRLAKVESEMKWSDQGRYILELALMEAARPETDERAALMARLEKLERRVAEGVPGPRADLPPAAAPAADSPPWEMSEAAPETLPAAPPAQPSEAPESSPPEPGPEPAGAPAGHFSGDAAAAWQKVLKVVKRERIALYTLIKSGVAQEVQDQVLFVGFEASPANQLYQGQMEKANNRDYLDEVAARALGEGWKIRSRRLKPADEPLFPAAQAFFGEMTEREENPS
ncbi:DNA polymerase III subunit gamma/tau [Gehongia tenuis]|uniref:DNA-directed DNA polymerase n=1 Tax=Gehongia tenuis TaxID=2763655 RepID=A0A926D2V1_9FIRM|nr:DNA polymerase III subunit gamma/tau [Gehongia tenuis]MBC8530337.1 DNA polymerase III subunit gamma/tau [Gehongia tenuis]